MVYVKLHVSRCLKEELAWVVDKWLGLLVIYTVGYTTKKLTNKAILNLKQYCMHCYVALSDIRNLINAYEDMFQPNRKMLRRLASYKVRIIVFIVV